MMSDDIIYLVCDYCHYNQLVLHVCLLQVRLHLMQVLKDNLCYCWTLPVYDNG